MTDHPEGLTAEDLAQAVPDDTPQLMPAPPQPPAEVTADEVQTAVQAETAWLQAQMVTQLQQRSHALHASLLLAQRQLAAANTELAELRAALIELRQNDE